MVFRAIPLLGVLIGLTGAAGALTAQATDNMTRIENGLTSSKRSIASRMQTHDITGMSLVIVEDNAIKWRRGYGLRLANDPKSRVTSATTFDAASVSKPIAATAALRLVYQRRVSLTDTRIMVALAAKHVGPVQTATFLRQFAAPGDIDLTRLLSHCAGVLSEHQVDKLSSTGAQSFALTRALPSMRQQLLGLSPAGATYKPVQTTALKPGTKYQYSGASYQLVEAVVDRYAPDGFSSYTTEMFRDLDMSSTTFADYPVLSTVSAIRRSSRHARGHANGSTRAASNYANHAAASLVTTAEDLARFLIMVNRNGTYDGTRILNSTMVAALTGQISNARCANRTIGSRSGVMGLGMRANSTGTRHHRGTHGGYRAYIFARPTDRWAMAVLMTGGSADASAFAAELFRAVEGVYGFPARTLVE